MNIAAIPLPSGLRRLVDDLIGVVRGGVRRFWRGGDNAPAGEAMTLVRRLARILRCAFVLLAVHLDLPRTAGASPAKPKQTNTRPAVAPALRRPAFPLFARWRVRFDDAPQHPQPTALARAARDRVLTLRRRLDALSRALADPMAHVRRMARRLPARLMVFGWRLPRRPPPSHRRDYWEEFVRSFQEAQYALGEWRRRTRDIAPAASGS